MQKKQTVKVQSTESIIGLGKSKRLAAMRQSLERNADKEVLQHKPIGNKIGRETQQAREAIAQSIAKIKATYPQGMQNKLFSLRYGSEEKINQMSLQKIFTLLNISQKLAKEVGEVKYKNGETSA